MANIFEKEPVYISLDDYKDSSWKDLSIYSDEELKEFIYKSQIIIDDYVWSYWTPFESTQEFIFPVIWSDWESLIPNDIIISTVYVCDQLVANWDTIDGFISWGQILEEKTWDRTTKYSETSNANYVKNIPYEAMVILNKYKKVFFKQVL